MNNEVFITACTFKFPSVSTFVDLKKTLKDGNENIKLVPFNFFNGKTIGKIGVLEISKEEEFYPPKSEQKIMRLDVIASTICAQKLVQEAKIKPEKIEDIDLYIANGAFVEDMFNPESKLFKRFKKAFEEKDPKNRQQKFFRASPPLLALNTLTNATESYIAQFTGIAGKNTTFGNTSTSGFYAFQEAVNQISSGNSQIAIVGASNLSNVTSFLTHFDYLENTEWIESPGAVILLLESEQSAKKNNRKILAKISNSYHSKNIPVLFDENRKYELDIEPLSKTVIYSDTFSQNVEEKYVKWNKSFTLDDKFGNTGSASLLLNIASALTIVDEDESVDCIDTDQFNRSTFVQITKI